MVLIVTTTMIAFVVAAGVLLYSATKRYDSAVDGLQAAVTERESTQAEMLAELTNLRLSAIAMMNRVNDTSSGSEDPPLQVRMLTTAKDATWHAPRPSKAGDVVRRTLAALSCTRTYRLSAAVFVMGGARSAIGQDRSVPYYDYYDDLVALVLERLQLHRSEPSARVSPAKHPPLAREMKIICDWSPGQPLGPSPLQRHLPDVYLDLIAGEMSLMEEDTWAATSRV